VRTRHLISRPRPPVVSAEDIVRSTKVRPVGLGKSIGCSLAQPAMALPSESFDEQRRWKIAEVLAPYPIVGALVEALRVQQVDEAEKHYAPLRVQEPRRPTATLLRRRAGR
jgi:hypothetical protein